MDANDASKLVLWIAIVGLFGGGLGCLPFSASRKQTKPTEELSVGADCAG